MTLKWDYKTKRAHFPFAFYSRPRSFLNSIQQVLWPEKDPTLFPETCCLLAQSAEDASNILFAQTVNPYQKR